MAVNTSKILSLSQKLNFCRSVATHNPLWGIFGKEPEKKTAKPSKECCKKRKVCEREDPDLSHLEGQPYKTCGTAYIVQKDIIPPFETTFSEEDEILKKIEADVTIKDTVDDPMPPFSSVEQRLIDLTDRKLHPLYKRNNSWPKYEKYCDLIEKNESVKEKPYQCKVGPIEPEEIPAHLQLNKEVLEKKNIFADFKRVDLPKQMLVRLLEINKNRRSTLEKKKEVDKK